MTEPSYLQSITIGALQGVTANYVSSRVMQAAGPSPGFTSTGT